MDYIQQKMELYKKITGYKISQIAADMRQTEPKEVSRALRNKHPPSEEFIVKYYKMVRRELGITLEIANYPELFLPFLPFVYAVLSHKGKWYSVEKGNVYEMPQYTPELPELKGFFIPALPDDTEDLVLCQRLPVGWVRVKDYQTRHYYLTF